MYLLYECINLLGKSQLNNSGDVRILLLQFVSCIDKIVTSHKALCFGTNNLHDVRND